MKPAVIIATALIGILSFASCAERDLAKEGIFITPNAEGRYLLKEIRLDLSVPGTNKAVKTDWTTGDKINIWFDDHALQDTPDLVLAYNGTSWTGGHLREGCTVAQSGTLAALYESGNDLAAKFAGIKDDKAYFSAPAPFSSPCNGLIMTTTLIPYELDIHTAVLKAEIGSFVYATKFKVFLGQDSSMASPAEDYALKFSASSCESRVFTDYYAFVDDGATVFGFTAPADARYAGGVQESDGIAFYFNTITVESARVTFALREKSDGPSVTFSEKEQTLDVSATNALTEVNLEYSYFHQVLSDPVSSEELDDGQQIHITDKTDIAPTSSEELKDGRQLHLN